jgi:hypothetical protein
MVAFAHAPPDNGHERSGGAGINVDLRSSLRVLGVAGEMGKREGSRTLSGHQETWHGGYLVIELIRSYL